MITARALASNAIAGDTFGSAAALPGDGEDMDLVQRLKNWFRAAPPPQLFEPEVESSDRRGKDRRNALPGTRMLVIDDSATIVALLRRMLRQNNYLTIEAEDAEQGIELARAERPELIFLDIVLPGMNGFAALRQLRRDPLTRDIPIIMISGNEQATEEFYVHRIGADDFMKKPFSRAEVFARIERLLDAQDIPRRVPQAASGSEPGEPQAG